MVEDAVGLHEGEESASVQTERRRYFGRLTASSSGLAFFPSVACLSTLVADVESSTLLFRLTALAVVPVIARFVLSPILSLLTLSSSILL